VLDNWLATGHLWTQALLGVGVGLAVVEGYLVGRAALRRGRRG
jgi:hypothetical protein